MLFGLLLGEIFLRVREYSKQTKNKEIPLNVRCETCSYVYGLNPDHPQISRQRVRDRVYLKKTQETFRILFLGDSVTFGDGLEPSQALPQQLHKSLARRFSNRRWEVINAGVPGYSSFNQLQFYLEEGYKFQADLVLVGFCMNDVVDPLPHWRDVKIKIPDAAIPNIQYHRDEIIPRFRHQLPPQGLRVFSFIRRFFSPKLSPQRFPYREKVVNGKRWPTYLTAEDTLSIEVLMDRSTPEWKWLSKQYDQLKRATKRHVSKLVVTLFPLAYQMDADYPFFPQKLWANFCTDAALHCFDLLPQLNAPKNEVFRLHSPGYYDIWHLTARGSQLAAEQIADYLERQQLISVRKNRVARIP